MMARWGTHGDHPAIVVTPYSVSETYELTVKAFNYAEKFRTPVIILMDEIIGHLKERILIPDAVPVIQRSKLYGENLAQIAEVPVMYEYGTGHRGHTTGLYHDEKGLPTKTPADASAFMVRIMGKIGNYLDELADYEEYMMADAEYVIVSYGSTARSAKEAVNILRSRGIKAGLFRPKTLWLSPEKQIKKMAQSVKGIIVAEINLGQYIEEVQRATGHSNVVLSFTAVPSQLRPGLSLQGRI